MFMGRENLKILGANRGHEPGKARRAGFQPAGLGGIPAAQVFCGQDAREPPARMSVLRAHGPWKASFRFFACIGTMNQIGTPLPALSPHGGERVAEGRARGASWKGNTSKIWTRIGTMTFAIIDISMTAPRCGSHALAETLYAP